MANFPQFDFYSKIKDIYIEIHNYTFYHNPDEGSVENSRFIGRKRQVERLEMMLTQSESKSGAYLITGYRGMGKTSLVNQTLAHIKRAQSGLPSFGRFLRWYGILAFINIFIIKRLGDDLAVLDSSTIGNFFILLCSLLIILCLSLYFIYRTNPERIISEDLDFEKFKNTVYDLLDFDLIAQEKRTSRVILHDIGIISAVATFFLLFSMILSFRLNSFSHTYLSISFSWQDLQPKLILTSKTNFIFLIHLLVIIFFRKGLSKIWKLKSLFFPPSIFTGGVEKMDTQLKDVEKNIKNSVTCFSLIIY